MSWTINDSDANGYLNVCKLAATTDEYFLNFKSNSDYNRILEHVWFELGQKYLDEVCINYENKLDEIKENDMFGSPVTYYYEKVGNISPTTLRYLKNTSDIIDKFGVDIISIVEIGGGYGGLCKVLSSFINFKSYLLVDLEECNLLSKKYLNKFNLPAQSHRVEEIEVHEDFDLLISNYAFSECTREMQLEYIEKFIKKSQKFYVTHNNMNLHTNNISDMEFIEIVSDIFDIEYYPELGEEGNPKIIYGVKK